MLNPLRFVAQVIDNKDSSIERQHVIIENGHVRGSGSVMSAGAAFDTDLSCCPHSETLLKAVRSCKDVVGLSVTPSGRLCVKSGRFRALVPCLTDPTPGVHPMPSGTTEIDIDGAKLIKTFELLMPFVSVDTIRPWTNGILLRDQSAFATNNMSIIQAWLGVNIPEALNIPLAAIKIIVKHGIPPAKIISDGASITFIYNDNRWIKTLLYETTWPPLDTILDVKSNPRDIPDGFFAGIASLAKFGADIYFRDGQLCTSTHDNDGATYVVEGLASEGIYQLELLALLDGVASTADFDRYPEPATFFGDGVRGVCLGRRP